MVLQGWAVDPAPCFHLYGPLDLYDGYIILYLHPWYEERKLDKEERKMDKEERKMERVQERARSLNSDT